MEPLVLNKNTKKKKKSDLIRVFTVIALDNCDLLTISVPDLDRMRVEFPDIYEELYLDGHNRFAEEKKLKKNETKECIRKSGEIRSKFALLFMQGSEGSSNSDNENHLKRSGNKSSPILSKN